MDDDRLLAVTDEGKRQLELLVETLKAKKGNPDWDTFAEWIAQQSGLKASKDVLYRTTVGIYKKEPTFSAIAALSRVKELTFLDSAEHPTMDQLLSLLLGEIDAYGRPVGEVANNHVS